jgi:hypothetical protein
MLELEWHKHKTVFIFACRLFYIYSLLSGICDASPFLRKCGEEGLIIAFNLPYLRDFSENDRGSKVTSEQLLPPDDLLPTTVPQEIPLVY